MESLSQAKHLKMLVLKGDYIATDTMLALADALGTNRTLEGLAVGATFPVRRGWSLRSARHLL